MSPILLLHGSDRQAEETSIAGHVRERITRTEIQEHSEVWRIRLARRRPIIAIGFRTVNARAAVKRCRRKKDTVPVGASHFFAVYAVHRCPLPSALGKQFVPLIFSRHPPLATKSHMGGIILQIKHFFIVRESIVSIARFRAILGHCLIRPHAPLVGLPGIIFLRLRLAPSEIIPILLRRRCTNVAGCPFQARGKSQINGLVGIRNCLNPIRIFTPCGLISINRLSRDINGTSVGIFESIRA